jgi:hypothetical protein
LRSLTVSGAIVQQLARGIQAPMVELACADEVPDQVLTSFK